MIRAEYYIIFMEYWLQLVATFYLFIYFNLDPYAQFSFFFLINIYSLAIDMYCTWFPIQRGQRILHPPHLKIWINSTKAMIILPSFFFFFFRTTGILFYFMKKNVIEYSVN